MARKKKAPGKKNPAKVEPVKSEGFDDVDDFFFGSETGAFTRDEFDYDPFDDVSQSGQHPVAAPEGELKSTRMVMEVPDEIRDKADGLVAKKGKGKGKGKDKEPVATKDVPVVEEEKPAAKAKPAPKGRGKGKRKRGGKKEPAPKPVASGAPDPDEDSATVRATREHIDAVKVEAEATQPPGPDPTGLPDEDPTGLPEPDVQPTRSGDVDVPLSARRAAGTAALAAMEEGQVFVGDEEDGGAAEASEEHTPEPRKVADPAAVASAAAPVAAPEVPEDEELPGARDWKTAVAELVAEADSLSTKKVAADRAALLFEVGRILAHRMGDWTGAEARWEAAQQASNTYVPALRELVRLCAAREDWSRAVDLLARQADGAKDPAGKTAALLASAHIQLSQLDRLSEAGTDLTRALEVAPDNYIALRFLREIHYRTQAWSELVDVLRKARDLAEGGERLRIDYELGRLHDEVLKSPSDAVEGFRSCLSVDGRFIPAFLAAERLLQESGDTAGLLKLWRGAGAAWGGADASFWFARSARAGDAASLSQEQVDSDYRAAVAASPCPEVLSEEYRHWLESQGRWADLASACEDALEAEKNPKARAYLLSTLGRIALQQNGDAEAAGKHFEAAVSADATCVEAAEGKRQVLAAAADWDGLLSLLAASGEAASAAQVKLATNLKMAEVAEVKLEDLPSARLHLEAACLLAPNYLPALDALIDVLDRLDDPRALAERMEQASAIVDSAEAASCYSLRASMAWTRAGVRDKSIMALQKAASAGPGALLAREGLVHEYVADGRWSEAAETLRQAAAETEDAALRVSLLYRAARLYFVRTDDQDAAEAAYRSLLDLVPDFLPATMDLRAIYAGRGDWDAYGLIQQQEAEASEDPSTRAWWHLSAGQAYERAGRVEDAIGQYRAALEQEPGSPVVGSALRRVYRSTSDRSALAESYGLQLRGTTDARVADALRVQLVSALEGMGDAGGVGTEVGELLKSDTADELPLASMGILSEGLQLWDQAISVYAAVGDHKGMDAAARGACLFQQGLLLEEVREESDAAANLYDRAVDLSGGHAMALEGLERVHAQSGDAGALASVYAREAEASTSQPVRTFYALLAGEQLENLGQTDASMVSYRQAFDDPVGRERATDALRRLALQNRDLETLEHVALGLTEITDDGEAVSRWMELGEGLAAAGEDARATEAFTQALERKPGFLPALYHLERLHSDREDWNEVLQALEAIFDATRTAGVQKDVDARIQELLSDRGVTSDSAFDFYKKLHKREPNNLVALKGLGGIHLARGEHGDAKTYFEQYANKASDPVDKAEASTQLGRLAQELGEGADAAVAQFEAAIEHHPTHRPALDALREVHTAAENWNGLVGVIAREVSLADEDRRLPYFIEIAKIWEDKIGNAKVAISSWNKVMQEQPENVEAQDRLLALYQDAGDWSRYLDVADEALARLNGEELRDRNAALGQIAMGHALDVDRAVGYYKAAVSSDQPSAEALAELRAIARARGDWEQVIQLCEQEVEVATELPGKVALLEEAARVKLDQLLDRDGAAGLFKRAMALDASCNSALNFFADYYFDMEQWEDALPVFKNYEAVIANMDLEEDDEARIEATGFYYKYGAVISHAGEDDEALEQFAKALELTPTHLPSLEAAAPRYFEAEDWGKARETSRAILRLRGGTGDSASLTRLYLRLGQSELELGQGDSALKRFKKALDRTPNHVPALQGIARIHRLSEDWNSLLSTYNSIIKYARDPEQVIQAYMTKGDVLEQKLEFTDKAVLHYEKVLMYDKTNWDATARLGQIALRRGDTEKASDLATKAGKAARSDDEKALAALLGKLAAAPEQVEVGALVKEARGAFTGEADGVFEAFTTAVGSDTVDRTEAAAAFRTTFGPI